jgi:hypothetical protein
MSLLYSTLSASYGHHDGINDLEKRGWIHDQNLSNDEFSTFYHPEKRKMIFTVAGTHKASDWGTDVALAFGRLKDTDRYKRAHSAIRIAKEKYKPRKTIVTGHSLGSSIAQYISSKGDKVIGLDAGYTIGQSTKRGVHYRTEGDLVSILGSGAKRNITLPNNKSPLEKAVGNTLWMASPIAYGAFNAYNAHNISKIKK